MKVEEVGELGAAGWRCRGRHVVGKLRVDDACHVPIRRVGALITDANHRNPPSPSPRETSTSSNLTWGCHKSQFRNGVTMAEQQPDPEPGQPEAPQSPPLPAPHRSVAPGPRAVRLQQLFESSLSHMLGKVSWENLEGCYPTVAAGAPGMLRGVRKTMVERLEGMCKVGFCPWSVSSC